MTILPESERSTPGNATSFAAYLVCAVLVAIILVVDMRFPLGVAVGSAYIVPVLLALWARRTRFILSVAAVSSVLVIFAFLYKPPIEEMWKVVCNRGLALVTIWATAILCVRIKAIQQQLIRIASYDFLTGVMNRREGLNLLQMELSRAQRLGSPFSVMMLDIDHFKSINDRYGHDTGDVVLKKLAGILGENLRQYDYVCRYGGEEFLVVAPETPLHVAHELAERLRDKVSEALIKIEGKQAIAVTVSVGVASHAGEETVSALISRADGALYRAKEAGRNRVMVEE